MCSSGKLQRQDRSNLLSCIMLGVEIPQLIENYKLQANNVCTYKMHAIYKVSSEQMG